MASVDAVLPHVAERRVVVQLEPDTRGAAQYLLANVVDETCCGATTRRTFQLLGQVLAAELRSMTPVYYDHGWVLGRQEASVAGRPQRGAHNNESRPIALLTRASARWDHGLAVTVLANFHCEALQRSRSPGVAECFASADHALVSAQRTLAPALRAVSQTLRGGCLDLALQARVATYELVRDLTLYEMSVAHSLSVAAAAATLQADVVDLDLTGRTHTFLSLCRVRSST